MGRSRKGGAGGGAAQRPKGPPGGGRRRRQEKNFKRNSARELHQQLADLQAERKRKQERQEGSKAVKASKRSFQHLAESDTASDEPEAKRPQKQKPPAPTQKSTGFAKSFAPTEVSAAPFERHFWAGASPAGEPSEALKLQRKELGVKVRGEPIPPPVASFEARELPPAFAAFLRAQRAGGAKRAARFERPTPIQAQVWPAALCGLDVIGIAPTGSGKTLAYVLPAVPHVQAQQGPAGGDRRAPACLVLAPTRELAKQICDTCGGGGATGWLKRSFGLRAGAVYGGIGKELQIDSITTLGPPHILSATPGRLLDLLSLSALSMEHVTYLVLDEADRMLALGFEPQLTAIVKAIRPNRQALLFSATFPQKLQEAAEQWMSPKRVVVRVATMQLDPERHEPGEGAKPAGQTVGSSAEKAPGPAASQEGPKPVLTVSERISEAAAVSATSALTVSPTIQQTVHVCAEHKKLGKLAKFLDRVREAEKQAGARQRAGVLIFCAQIKTLRSVAKFVQKQGERCAPLHSGIPQGKREQALADLKSGKIDTVVATDLASRGLHITRLEHVVNYDFPSNLEVYCHRIGRVGRQGSKGWSLSFFTRNLQPMAGSLAALLERCGQWVDPNLRELAEPSAAAPEAEPDAEAEEPGSGAGDGVAGSGARAAAAGAGSMLERLRAGRGGGGPVLRRRGRRRAGAPRDDSLGGGEDPDGSDSAQSSRGRAVGQGGGLRIRPSRAQEASSEDEAGP